MRFRNSMNIDHSAMIASLLISWVILMPSVVSAEDVLVYKSPTCGCCKKWISHLEKNGFTVKSQDVKNIAPYKLEHGVPLTLTSCHTAVIGGYVVEGHVPASDIKRMLMEKPNIKGLTVPGMPVGSPGMEQGNVKQPYKVLSIGHDGKVSEYSRH